MKIILIIIAMLGAMSAHAQNNSGNSNLPFASNDYWIFLAFGIGLIFLIVVFNVIINALYAMKKFYAGRSETVQERRVLNPEIKIELPEISRLSKEMLLPVRSASS